MLHLNFPWLSVLKLTNKSAQCEVLCDDDVYKDERTEFTSKH